MLERFQELTATERGKLIAGPPEGLRAVDAAAFVGVSVSQWRELDRSALCPAAVQLGDRLPVWPRLELRAWLLDGAPSRAEWASRRQAAIDRLAREGGK
jgi:hypothetical protein